MEAGSLNEAISAYSRVIDGYRGDRLAADDVTSALTNKAISLLRLGRRSEAISICGEIRERLVGSTDAHSLLILETVERIEQVPILPPPTA